MLERSSIDEGAMRSAVDQPDRDPDGSADASHDHSAAPLFLSIKNWDRFQHDKDGKPLDGSLAWIRDWTNKEADDDYSKLSFSQRYVFDALRRLRGRLGKNPPAEFRYLANALMASRADRKSIKPAIRALYELGLISIVDVSGTALTASEMESVGYLLGSCWVTVGLQTPVQPALDSTNSKFKVDKNRVEAAADAETPIKPAQSSPSKPASSGLPIGFNRKPKDRTDKPIQFGSWSAADQNAWYEKWFPANPKDSPQPSSVQPIPAKATTFDLLSFAEPVNGKEQSYTAEQVRLCLLYHFQFSKDPYWKNAKIGSAKRLARAIDSMWEQVPAGWTPPAPKKKMADAQLEHSALLRKIEEEFQATLPSCTGCKGKGTVVGQFNPEAPCRECESRRIAIVKRLRSA